MGVVRRVIGLWVLPSVVCNGAWSPQNSHSGLKYIAWLWEEVHVPEHTESGQPRLPSRPAFACLPFKPSDRPVPLTTILAEEQKCNGAHTVLRSVVSAW